jgi:guanine deaminase
MTGMPDAELMRRALARARVGVAAGQTPFGALIARGDRVVACEHNAVWAATDSTAHAEVQAIRAACRALGTVDLSGCTVYSTCEPCPMCFAAIHWAHVATVVYGARIADARALGFSELTIPNRTMKQLGGSPVEIVENFLREECLALFEEWAARADRRTY